MKLFIQVILFSGLITNYPVRNRCKQSKTASPLAITFTFPPQRTHFNSTNKRIFETSKRDTMSLPGLDLAQSSVETEFTPAPPTQVSLTRGSEWRFEVAHGTTVRVKVHLVYTYSSHSMNT